MKLLDILREQRIPQLERSKLMQKFIKFCIQELDLKSPLPKIIITNDKTQTETYGHFSPNDNSIVVYQGNRSFNDIARTICHELIHERQRQRNQLTPSSGKDGSEHENEANALSGVILRKWGRICPNCYE